jgi:hypothetical protein
MDTAELKKLQARLHKLTLCPTEPVEEGWLSRRDLERAWGVSTSVAVKLIGVGIRSGVMEKRKFRVNTPRGCYNTPHYRVID